MRDPQAALAEDLLDLCETAILAGLLDDAVISRASDLASTAPCREPFRTRRRPKR